MEKQWDQDKIEQLIRDKIEERLTLEYKGCDALSRSPGKKKEITKDISAMANSAGGIVIYGVREFDEDDKRHIPETIESVDRINFPKEWLQQVIDNIRPKINNLVIHSVSIDSGPNDVAYVVDVPQSTTAHQANDKRYYKRFNFESSPMDDYEIRDVMARIKEPKIELSLSIFDARSSRPTLYVGASNTGSVYAKYVKGILQVPQCLLNASETRETGVVCQLFEIDNQGVWEISVDNLQRDVLSSGYSTNSSGIGERTTTQGPSWFNPILPGTTEALVYLILVGGFHTYYYGPRSTDLSIKWTISADSAPPNSGEIVISDIPEIPD